jgi:hypothetical protein
LKSIRPKVVANAPTARSHPSSQDTAIDTALLKQVFSFAARLSGLVTPAEVLAALAAAIQGRVPLKVLGAARLPVQLRDWLVAPLGETVFLAVSAPRGWWEEYMGPCRSSVDQDLMMARTSLAAFTWTESRRKLEPIGVDRWPYDLDSSSACAMDLLAPWGSVGLWPFGLRRC